MFTLHNDNNYIGNGYIIYIHYSDENFVKYFPKWFRPILWAVSIDIVFFIPQLGFIDVNNSHTYLTTSDRTFKTLLILYNNL